MFFPKNKSKNRRGDPYKKEKKRASRIARAEEEIP
jgi:hypothetical protein